MFFFDVGVHASTVDWPLCVSVLRLIALDHPYPLDFARQLTSQQPQQPQSQSQSQSQQQQQSQSHQPQHQQEIEQQQSSQSPQSSLPHLPKTHLLGIKPISPQEWSHRQEEAFSRIINVLLAYLVPPSRLFSPHLDKDKGGVLYNNVVGSDGGEMEGGAMGDDNMHNTTPLTTTTTANNKNSSSNSNNSNSNTNNINIQVRRQGRFTSFQPKDINLLSLLLFTNYNSLTTPHYYFETY